MIKSEVWTGIIIVVVLATLGAAWALMSALSVAVLKAALILALGAVPVVFWAGWRMGARDAKMFLQGVDRGTGAVMNAGGKVADLRTAKAQVQQSAMPEVRLPDATRLEIINVASNGEVVEL